MVKDSLKGVLIRELEKIIPPNGDIEVLKERTKKVIDTLKNNIKKFKIKADVFIGGSFAKNTLIKKNKYDVDLFVRFDKKYSEEDMALKLGKIVPNTALRVHGSRDYFIVKDNEFEVEIIPTIKISNPSQAKNITDLSYFHVNYVLGKIKKQKGLADEIRLAKAFLHYSDCYGAESYINGFSGYAVELLVIYYGSFIKFIQNITKVDSSKGKLILDPAKLFKNKQDIMKQINESKLNSPIVIIDPTFNERNALAALSDSTFIRFQDYCKKFLKNPSSEFFKIKDREKLLREKFNDVIELGITTDRQSGDIAGTKLKKFYGFFIQELGGFFDVKKSEFLYDETTNKGKILISATQKKEIIFSGPPIIMKDRLAEFKKEHKKIEIKNGKSFAREKSISFDEFLKNLYNVKRVTIESMGITNLEKV